jgi:hypothetical protein
MTPHPARLDDWPPWALDAQQRMEACGIPPEVILTRAILLGINIEPHRHHSPANWISKRDDGGGLLGVTHEMLAYRWLAMYHPSAVGLKKQYTYGERNTS